MPLLRTTMVDVDLDAIVANARAVRERAGVELIAVVKADAYGHGAEAAAEAAVEGGAAMLAVATVEEAIVLRRARPDDAILVLLGAQGADECTAAVEARCAVVVWDEASARALAEAARAQRSSVSVHFKVDTGLTRLGSPLDDAERRYRELSDIAGLVVDGVFTHLARSDERDLATTELQLDRFDALLGAIDRPRWVHASASGGLLSQATRPGMTAVRVGLALYGLSPAPHLAAVVPLRPALTWRSRVHRVAGVSAGTGVSYGHEYRVTRPSRIATVPVGYGDGLPRIAGSRARLLVQGTALGIAGRVAMDHVMVDVTGLEGVDAGDEVVLIGTQGAATLTAEDLALACGTINYEVVTAIRPRVPRRYHRAGRVVGYKTLSGGYARC